MNEYRVQVDAYNGPLDLLLYLIRREEVDIYDIPIARVAEQYGRYVEVLQIIDPNIAGDFLVMMATLMELKSRAMLPRVLAIEDEEEGFEDPRLELVRQLLAYKSFKDAARSLGTAAEVQALRHPRKPVGPPLEERDRELDLEDVSIWALVHAFGALLEQTGRGTPTHEVVVDDTPLSLHADDIVDSLSRSGGSQLFEAIFAGRSKIEMIGLFLALLELIRRRRIRITQQEQFGPITLHLVEEAPMEEDSKWEEDVEWFPDRTSEDASEPERETQPSGAIPSTEDTPDPHASDDQGETSFGDPEPGDVNDREPAAAEADDDMRGIDS
jgi:segregation and condensation protein A